MKATAFTDASMKGGTVGWAACVMMENAKGPVVKSGAFHCQHSATDLAEKVAAVKGISIAASRGATDVCVVTDSKAVVCILDGTTKRPAALNEWAGLLEAAGVGEVMLKGAYVRAHTNAQDAQSKINRLCDVMAKAARKRLPARHVEKLKAGGNTP